MADNEREGFFENTWVGNTWDNMALASHYEDIRGFREFIESKPELNQALSSIQGGNSDMDQREFLDTLSGEDKEYFTRLRETLSNEHAESLVTNLAQDQELQTAVMGLLGQGISATPEGNIRQMGETLDFVHDLVEDHDAPIGARGRYLSEEYDGIEGFVEQPSILENISTSLENPSVRDFVVDISQRPDDLALLRGLSDPRPVASESQTTMRIGTYHYHAGDADARVVDTYNMSETLRVLAENDEIIPKIEEILEHEEKRELLTTLNENPAMRRALEGLSVTNAPQYEVVAEAINEPGLIQPAQLQLAEPPMVSAVNSLHSMSDQTVSQLNELISNPQTAQLLTDLARPENTELREAFAVLSAPDGQEPNPDMDINEMVNTLYTMDADELDSLQFIVANQNMNQFVQTLADPEHEDLKNAMMALAGVDAESAADMDAGDMIEALRDNVSPAAAGAFNQMLESEQGEQFEAFVIQMGNDPELVENLGAVMGSSEGPGAFLENLNTMMQSDPEILTKIETIMSADGADAFFAELAENEGLTDLIGSEGMTAEEQQRLIDGIADRLAENPQYLATAAEGLDKYEGALSSLTNMSAGFSGMFGGGQGTQQQGRGLSVNPLGALDALVQMEDIAAGRTNPLQDMADQISHHFPNQFGEMLSGFLGQLGEFLGPLMESLSGFLGGIQAPQDTVSSNPSGPVLQPHVADPTIDPRIVEAGNRLSDNAFIADKDAAAEAVAEYLEDNGYDSMGDIPQEEREQLLDNAFSSIGGVQTGMSMNYDALTHAIVHQQNPALVNQQTLQQQYQQSQNDPTVQQPVMDM